MTPTLLVVDDEEGYRALARIAMTERGWTVFEAGNAATALQMIKEKDFDLLLIDGYLGDATGPELARALLGIRPGLRILIYSVMNEELAANALEAGALACLPKPARFDEVAAFVAEDRA